jgi:sirohydrochlorin cobaltochelatase
MKTILVLAMHGAPPNDFPKNDLAELMGLHHQLENTPDPQQAMLLERYLELQTRVRSWPRTALNDPFFAGSTKLAQQLEETSGLPVLLGFNEFCAPSLDETLERAASNAEQVLVVTPMVTRGGEHSERDIPASISRVRFKHPEASFTYVWPFDIGDVARFLSEQVHKQMKRASRI